MRAPWGTSITPTKPINCNIIMEDKNAHHPFSIGSNFLILWTLRNLGLVWHATPISTSSYRILLTNCLQAMAHATTLSKSARRALGCAKGQIHRRCCLGLFSDLSNEDAKWRLQHARACQGRFLKFFQQMWKWNVLNATRGNIFTKSSSGAAM